MPRHETAHRHQKAVLWPAQGVDQYGQPRVGEPVQLKVSWIVQHREILGPQGDTIVLDVLAVVDRKISVDSIMWLGELSHIPQSRDFSQESEKLMQVKLYNETPSINGRNFRRTVSLMRYRDTLPESALPADQP